MAVKTADYFQVDAFADRLCAGNPAGVCLLDDWLPDTVLQAVAFENGLSETAFVVYRGAGRFGLRWFTPEVEVDLCGHATLASAHVLATLGFSAPWTFESLSGLLVVKREQDWLVLDFPAAPGEPVGLPEALRRGLGCVPEATFRARDYLAVLSSEEAVRHLQPDFAALAQLDGRGVIATAPGRDCDFVSRFFAPKVGIPEDPVTGSAHCTLAPYWAQRLGRLRLDARQLSRRGGVLWCEPSGDRVLIGGRAITYLSGKITLPAK